MDAKKHWDGLNSQLLNKSNEDRVKTFAEERQNRQAVQSVIQRQIDEKIEFDKSARKHDQLEAQRQMISEQARLDHNNSMSALINVDLINDMKLSNGKAIDQKKFAKKFRQKTIKMEAQEIQMQAKIREQKHKTEQLQRRVKELKNLKNLDLQR